MKGCLQVFFVIILIGLIAGVLIPDPDPPRNPSQARQQPAQPQPKPAPPPAPPAKVDPAAAAPVAANRLRADIHKAVSKWSERIIEIDIRDSLAEPGKKLIDVVFEGSQNLTKSMMRGGIENGMRDGYEAIFTSGIPVQWATMEAHMVVMDKLGNESLGLVYGTKLESEKAAGVNWTNKRVIDWSQIWTVYWLNQSLK